MRASWFLLLALATGCSYSYPASQSRPPDAEEQGGSGGTAIDSGGSGGTTESGGAGGSAGSGGSAGTGGIAADCQEGASRPCDLTMHCGPGTETCESGKWSACTFVPKPDICNGVDDDCDGVIDDGRRNDCGGSCQLDGAIGDPCGAPSSCGHGHLDCDGLNALRCAPSPEGQVAWVWARGWRGDDVLHAIAATSDGGAVVYGTTPGGLELVSGVPEQGSGFVAGIDGDGNTVWAHSIGGGVFGDVAVTPQGKILLLLMLDESNPNQSGPLVLEGAERSFRATSPGAYLARLDAGGEPELLVPLADDVGWSADVAATSDGGASVVLGGYSRPVTLAGSFEGRTVTVPWNGAVLIKLDAGLQGQWARVLESKYFTSQTRVAGGDAIFVAASSSAGPVHVSLGEKDELMVGDENAGIVLARYSLAGDLRWARFMGAAGSFALGKLAEGPGSVPLLSGWLEFGVSLGDTLTFPGGATFVARWDGNGVLSWINGLSWDSGVANQERSTPAAVAPTADGGAFLATTCVGAVVAGRGDPEETKLYCNGISTPVTARFDAAGKLAWAQDATGLGLNTLVDAATASDGDLLAAGVVSSDDLTFGRCEQSVAVPHVAAADVLAVKIEP